MNIKKLAKFIIDNTTNLFGSFAKCPEDAKSMMIKNVSKKFGVSESDLIAEIATVLMFEKKLNLFISLILTGYKENRKWKRL